MPSFTDKGWEGAFALFTTFARAGVSALAGGYATICPLRDSLVVEGKVLEAEAFDRVVTLAQSLPGIFSLNLSALLGHRLRGWPGAVLALLGMLLPAFVSVLIVASFFNDFRESPAVASFLRGARPAVIALMVVPFLQMVRRTEMSLSTMWIPVGAALAVGLFGVSPIYIVVGLCVIAALYGWFVRPNE